MVLWDGTGVQLAANDDASSTTRNALITYTAPATTTLYLDAGAFANAYTGTYTVVATDLTPPPPPVGFSSVDGYGEANVARALDLLTGQPLPRQAPLGGVFWGLDRVGAPTAWAAGVTAAGITVAVVDTGVDTTHTDLDANIWSNPGEIAGNGIDDDNNGFIDDSRGWDFVSGDNDPMDLNGHGTHVAGTIAAENNGTGQTGVAYGARIMPVRVLDAAGSGTYAAIASGVRYATANGARVINLSLGGGTGSPDLQAAIQDAAARGVVVVMAAGNDGAATVGYPAAYAASVGLAVGAVDLNGTMASFSNRAGSTPLDYVTAPGVNVYSTLPGNTYGLFSGTSMATPHLAGLAALILGYRPTLTAAQVEALLTASASHGSGLFTA
ncbi:MAG: peptidase S8 [Cyanobacteria bacterium WB6_1B_304]|nr:peptidase S8 [Cyanobacteria bacterium WB6_1B_304]